jgi:hypothetical protein
LRNFHDGSRIETMDPLPKARPVGALDPYVAQPWKTLPPDLEPLARVTDEVDARALEVLRGAERKGIWGDGGDNAARSALALLRSDLAAGADLVDGAEGYGRLVEIEKRGHSDPTPDARRALRVIAPLLREGESMKEAAEAYDALLRFETGRDIDGSRHAREAFRLVDGSMLDCQSRRVAAEAYIADPASFQKRQMAEKARFEERQAQLREVAERVSREPRSVGGIEQAEDGWLVVGGVRIPRRG